MCSDAEITVTVSGELEAAWLFEDLSGECNCPLSAADGQQMRLQLIESLTPYLRPPFKIQIEIM